MGKKRDEAPKPEAVELSLAYEFPDSLSIGAFANHMLVQRDEHDFHISFFQVVPPIIVGDEPERREKVKHLGAVPAKCVARIIVAQQFLPRVIEALQANMTKVLKQDNGQNGKGGSHDKTA